MYFVKRFLKSTLRTTFHRFPLKKKKLREINYQTAITTRPCHAFVRVFGHSCLVFGPTNVKKEQQKLQRKFHTALSP